MSVRWSRSPTSPGQSGVFRIRKVLIERFADRFGRKKSFYLAWVWLVVVSGIGPLRYWLDAHQKGCVFLNTAKSPSVWALAKLCNGAGIGILQWVLARDEYGGC